MEQVVWVRGAGSPQANGEYKRDGAWDGHPMYTNAATGFQIWHTSDLGGYWRLGRDSDWYYVAHVDTHLPPVSNWMLAKDESDPAYLKSANIYTSAPTPSLSPHAPTSQEEAVEQDTKEGELQTNATSVEQAGEAVLEFQNTPKVIWVSNAGSREVYGKYAHDGDYDGHPMYTNKETQVQIWHAGFQDTGYWRMGKSGDWYYVAHVDTSDPPKSHWMLARDETDRNYTGSANQSASVPTPTLSETQEAQEAYTDLVSIDGEIEMELEKSGNPQLTAYYTTLKNQQYFDVCSEEEHRIKNGYKNYKDAYRQRWTAAKDAFLQKTNAKSLAQDKVPDDQGPTVAVSVTNSKDREQPLPEMKNSEEEEDTQTGSTLSAWWTCFNLMHSKVSEALDMASDINVAVSLAAVTYTVNEVPGVTFTRHGAWASIITFSVIMPFVLSWCSKVMLDRIADPLEKSAEKGERAEGWREWHAYFHVMPIFGVPYMILLEVYDAFEVLIIFPYHTLRGTFKEYITNTYGQVSENDTSKSAQEEAFFEIMEKSKRDELCRGIFFRFWFENMIQMLLQIHIVFNISQLDKDPAFKAQDVIDTASFTQDVWVSLFFTVVSTAKILYTVYTEYRKWELSFLSTWLICLLGNKLDFLRKLGYYSRDWLDEKQQLITPPLELLRTDEVTQSRRKAMIQSATKLFTEQGYKRSDLYDFFEDPETYADGIPVVAATLFTERPIEINLYQKLKGDHTAELLGHCISNMTADQVSKVDWISAACTPISDRGVVAIARSLHHLRHMKNGVYMRDCTGGISDVGAKALADALGSIPHIRLLSLHGNDIGNDGAESLARAGAAHPSLLKLTLFKNKRVTWDMEQKCTAIWRTTSRAKVEACRASSPDELVEHPGLQWRA